MHALLRLGCSASDGAAATATATATVTAANRAALTLLRRLVHAYAPLYRHHPSRYHLALALLATPPPHAARRAPTPQTRLHVLTLISPPLPPPPLPPPPATEVAEVTLRLTVPEGVGPGGAFLCKLPSGATHQVTLPHGATPGSSLTLRVPSTAPAPARPSGAGARQRRWWCVTAAFRQYAAAVGPAAEAGAEEGVEGRERAAAAPESESEYEAARRGQAWARAAPGACQRAEVSAAEEEAAAEAAWSAAEAAAGAPPALPASLALERCTPPTVAYAQCLLRDLVAELAAADSSPHLVPQLSLEMQSPAQRSLCRARAELLCVPRAADELGEALAAAVLVINQGGGLEADSAAAERARRGEGGEMQAAAAAAGWLATRSVAPLRAALVRCACAAACRALRPPPPEAGGEVGGEAGGEAGGEGAGLVDLVDERLVEASLCLLGAVWHLSATSHAVAECRGFLGRLAADGAAAAGAAAGSSAVAAVRAFRLAVRCAAPLCERLRAEACGEVTPKAGEAERGRSRASTSRNAMQAAADMQASLLDQLRQLQQLQRAAAAHGTQAQLEADEMLRDLVEHVSRQG